MTSRKVSHFRSPLFWFTAACGVSLPAVAAIATLHAAPQNQKPDAAASREAFLQV